MRIAWHRFWIWYHSINTNPRHFTVGEFIAKCKKIGDHINALEKLGVKYTNTKEDK
jgi:hypothetical protein